MHLFIRFLGDCWLSIGEMSEASGGSSVGLETKVGKCKQCDRTVWMDISGNVCSECCGQLIASSAKSTGVARDGTTPGEQASGAASRADGGNTSPSAGDQTTFESRDGQHGGAGNSDGQQGGGGSRDGQHGGPGNRDGQQGGGGSRDGQQGGGGSRDGQQGGGGSRDGQQGGGGSRDEQQGGGGNRDGPHGGAWNRDGQQGGGSRDGQQGGGGSRDGQQGGGGSRDGQQGGGGNWDGQQGGGGSRDGQQGGGGSMDGQRGTDNKSDVSHGGKSLPTGSNSRQKEVANTGQEQSKATNLQTKLYASTAVNAPFHPGPGGPSSEEKQLEQNPPQPGAQVKSYASAVVDKTQNPAIDSGELKAAASANSPQPVRGMSLVYSRNTLVGVAIAGDFLAFITLVS